MDAVLSFVAGYLVGSIPLGLLIGRLAGGVDIRRFGTGNIGASNTYRNLGMVPAAVVGVGSFLQGFLPAWASGQLTHSLVPPAAAGVGSVAGYAWSVFLRLRGGSAVGTATGALAGVVPWGLVPLLTCYALGGLLRRPAPLVLLGLIASVVYLILVREPVPVVVAAAVVVAVVVAKRLDGIVADVREDPAHQLSIAVDRLVNDRKPGRRLEGPIGGTSVR
jgi:acyl phosphate:glycerol-3-phosphate acyltransferase